ncbi:MAG TPA: hypothetical protein VFE42_36030 [Chloroflexota bacterium]|nr:hypothetical protein [Chloroflexota bacterium]
MKTIRIKRIIAGATLAALFIVGGVLRLSAHADGGITIPGSISDLPQANGVTYEGPLAVGSQFVTSRQALDSAEAEFGLTDGQIDLTARAVPVVVSVGLTPSLQHIQAWVVTANADLLSAGRPGTQGTITHKMCIIVDAMTGRYIMAYAAGPRYPVNQ